MTGHFLMEREEVGRGDEFMEFVVGLAGKTQ